MLITLENSEFSYAYRYRNYGQRQEFIVCESATHKMQNRSLYIKLSHFREVYMLHAFLTRAHRMVSRPPSYKLHVMCQNPTLMASWQLWQGFKIPYF